MNLVIGKKYRYENIVRVGRSCKKQKKSLEVIYAGKEGNKEVFDVEDGRQILIHETDVDNVIVEI